MTDSLKIWGTDYTGVKGFKAKDSSNNQYAYLRPQGTKSITENGNNIDVSEYAIASVNVDRTGGHVIQEGSSIVIPADEVDSGYSLDDIAQRNFSGGAVTITATRIYPFSFMRSSFTSVNAPNCERFTDSANWLNAGVGQNVFRGCASLTSISFPELIDVGSGGYQFAECTSLTEVNLPKSNCGQHMFDGCTSLINIVLPYNGTADRKTNGYVFSGCSNLEAVDMCISGALKLQNNEFNNCVKFTTLILRTSTLVTLGNTNVFNNCPFKSGGTGGTIYIPKVLYDHLGDGTSDDYQAATNWSTIYGYGTITWAKIEGSYYETHYADGTEIPSA